MKRIWSLRLNLDEFNALAGMAFTDSDRASVLNGLLAGMNRAQLPEQCSSIVRAAFDAGVRWRLDAEEYVEKKANAGKRSADARREKYGDAQPSSSDRTPLEQSSNITNNDKPITTNEERGKASSPSRARQSAEKKEMPPIPEELLPFLETLTRDWPRRSHDGRRVTILRPKDSWEKICKNRGDDDPKIPVNAALAYLDTNPTQYVIGMDNFFGVARKYTKFVVED